MVQSLLRQPILEEAIARSPLRTFSEINVNADIGQNLREALERHKLPDEVQSHYDYRILQLPEALANYAFRLVAYGEPFSDDVRATTHAAGPVENMPNHLHSKLEGQPLAPPSIPPADGYWNPEDRFSYSPKTGQSVDPDIVPNCRPGNMLAVASGRNQGMGSSRFNIQHLAGAGPMQFYGETVKGASAIASSEQPPSVQLFSNPGHAIQEPSSGEKGRGRARSSVKRSFQNLIHRSSPSKPGPSHSDKIPPGPGKADGRASEYSRTTTALEIHRESTSVEPMEAVSNSPRPDRLSRRMSFQWTEFVMFHPEEQHDSSSRLQTNGLPLPNSTEGQEDSLQSTHYRAMPT